MNKVNLNNVSENQAYEWVKTGHWNLQKFQEWVYFVMQKSYDEGYKNCDEDIAMGAP